MSNNSMMKEAEKYCAEYYKKGRILVWHDEFDKELIDENKWVFYRSMYCSDRIYDNSEKNARIENGKMLLQCHRTDNPDFPFTLPEGFTTKYTMNFKYGYLEMRAKIPFRHGAWPSFWLQSSTVFQKAPWMCETDIFEVFSNDRGIESAIHKWGYHKNASKLISKYYFENYKNLNDEYHIYGYEWTPEYMAFSVDGHEYARCPIDPVNGNFGYDIIDGTSAFHDFQYIIINDEVFTEKSSYKPNGYLTDEDQLPINYYIDWVRLYQNPEKEEIKLKAEIDEVRAAKEI